MILYLPVIYEDETIYSYLSRVYEKCGYISTIQAKRDFFKSTKDYMDFIFSNNISCEIINRLTKYCSWKELISNHTLCNYYGRYLQKEKRVVAMQSLYNLSGNYNNLFSITPNKNGYLKYCPMCVKENREKYGETYWNRIHQIPELNICQKHYCKLLKSNISTNKKKTTCFCTAESNIVDLHIESAKKLEIQISKYIKKMVCTPINIEAEINPGKFIISKMQNTKYVSHRGHIINTGILFEDMKSFYNDLENSISEVWQISKTLHNNCINPYSIIQIALFLNISEEDIIMCKKVNTDNIFDLKVTELLKSGKSVYKISKDLGVSTSLIHLIKKKYNITNEINSKYSTKRCENKQEKIEDIRELWKNEMLKYEQQSFSKICEKSEYGQQLKWLRRNDKEWTDNNYPTKEKKSKRLQKLNDKDDKYLPQMKKVIEEYLISDNMIPKRVTINAISSYMGWNNRDLYYMEKCRKIVEEYKETNEEFWLRKIKWSIKTIEDNNMKMNWNSVRKLTNLSSANFLKHINYFKEKLNDETIESITP